MRDIKQAFWIAGQNFYGWKKSPRIWMTFILAAILCLMLSDQIISHAIKYETILQVFEPFIWTYGDASSVMLSSLLLILLFADMPFISQATPYWLVRTKRKIWLAGQIIYVILATVIYNIFLAVMLVIMGAPFAPDEASAPEKMEIKFQKKTEDHGVEAARSWMSTELENTDTEDYFTADVGEDRKAYIEAERYNQEIDNDSSFLWMEGSNFIEEETIETEEMQSEYYSSFGMDTNGYTEKFHELADAYRKCMDKITFTEEDGKEQAEQVLEDLGIDGMGLVDSDRTVWFPNGACSERNGLGLGSDALWQGDLDRGLPGYLYCFSKSVEGITSVPDGVVAEETVDSYVPPFQVETISILITEEGIKYFKWDGISEEVCTVTENTKLLPFEKIQAKLTDQIFYWYSGKGQSANDTTALEYDVVNAKLQYTYTTAYQEPKHAWLVPAWIFTVRESIGGNSLQELSYVINAYDGSVIGEAY